MSHTTRVRGRPRPPRAGRAAKATAAAIAVVWGVCAPSPSLGAGSGTRGGVDGPSGAPARASRAWSAPRVLAQCAFAEGPQVAFPSEGPTRRTGDGAISWMSHPAPCTARSHRSGRWGVSVAALGPSDQARVTRVHPFEGESRVRATVGASLGRIAVAAANASSTPGGADSLLQGAASDPTAWSRVLAGSGPQLALGRAYLGDVAVAVVAPGPSIRVRVERYYKSGFGAPRSIPIGTGAVTALTVAMDYRSDVLLAWQQDRSIYACMLRASGRIGTVERVGPSGLYPQLQAVVSDNDHGMIAWSSTGIPEGSTPRTRIFLSLSGTGVHFGAPHLLASFADPERVGRSPGSIALQRLSTENVMLVWTVAEHGRYLIRAAPAVFAASRPARLLSDPRSQAVLADLAPGPEGEAIAVWRTAPSLAGGALDMRRGELWAARASIAPHSRIVLGDLQEIAPQGPNLAPTLAVDPANDRAVAAWLVSGAQLQIEYAVGPGSTAYRPHRTVVASGPPRAGVHRLRITLAAAGLALAAAALALRRRRRPQQR